MQTQTKNWNDLPNLMDTHELSNADDACLKELQSVIEKYGLTSKFGVSLLHQHFPIGEDEVLLESNDPNTRMLTSQPIKVSNVNNGDYATTLWRFDGGMRYGCAFCQKNHCDTN